VDRSSLDALRMVRARTGAPLHECRAALERAVGDIDRAADDLVERLVARVAELARCPATQARAGVARFGWDLGRACEEARRHLMDAEPELAAQTRRKWQEQILRDASRLDRLMPLVHDAALSESPLGRAIAAVGELDDDLDRDEPYFSTPGPFNIRSHVLDALTQIPAVEARRLFAVLDATPLDVAAARRCIAALYPRLRDELAHALSRSGAPAC
jgi:hypothetical protein